MPCSLSQGYCGGAPWPSSSTEGLGMGRETARQGPPHLSKQPGAIRSLRPEELYKSQVVGLRDPLQGWDMGPQVMCPRTGRSPKRALVWSLEGRRGQRLAEHPSGRCVRSL